MRKLKCVLVGCLAAVLIISISALPFGISAIMDSTNHNKSNLSDMDTIQLNLNGEMTELAPVQKLQLVGCGASTEVAENQALHTPDQIKQLVIENLQRYTDAGLFIGDVSILEMQVCAPLLYYNIDDAEQYNIFWTVEMTDIAPEQKLELLIDDNSGAIYLIDYYCTAEAAIDSSSATKANVERLAVCFFDSLHIDYVVEDCYQSENKTWYLSAVCSDRNQEVKVELYYFGNGFYCEINS